MAPPPSPIDHRGRTIDFGKTAGDYERFRPGFPRSMYERLASMGWIASGMRTLDLGTGTGALALELAERGLDVVGLDPSARLLDVAARRAEQRGLSIRFSCQTAEDTGEPNGFFDLVTAGQCWWWLEARRALAESRRVLRPRGRLLIANFCYLPVPNSVAARTEALVLRHNPAWPKAGESGLFEAQVRDLDAAGFHQVESFSYVASVPFSHEAWRGRMRACNGVGAALEPEDVISFDQELGAMLAREFPGELEVGHRVFVATGTS